jgi:hypothetical protein
MKKFTDPRMHDCIQHCWDCRDTCQATLYNYCLARGGHHVEQAHVRVMEDCIQICQTAADFMTRGSDQHAAICAACADVCDACAESCEMMDDEEMTACARVCRACAESCREMSRMAGMPGGDRRAEDAAGLTPL